MSRVLIIEDDEILNAGLCFHLQRKEIEVEPAYSLAEAEEYLKGHEPDSDPSGCESAGWKRF